MNPVEILERALDRIAFPLEISGQALVDTERDIREALAALRGPDPDWGEAPTCPEPGAQFYTVDANGCARWWKREPRPTGTGTWGAKGRGGWWIAGNVILPLGTDWRLTLRKRPEAQ